MRDNFTIDKKNKTIILHEWMGALDFYKECMKVFSTSSYMECQTPVKIEPVSSLAQKLLFVNDWKLKNDYLLSDQTSTFTTFSIGEESKKYRLS